MTQYISKATLVAEIDKGINGRNDWQLDEYRKGYHDALTMLKKYLSTFKVKGVDLEKNISDWLSEGLPNDEELIDYIKETAKHFFELGLKVAQKGE